MLSVSQFCAAVAAIAFLGSAPIQAAVKSIECDPPRGPSGEFRFRTDTAMQWIEDGYTGVRPLFIFDEAKPTELIYYWGDTKVPGITPEMVPPSRRLQAFVIKSSPLALLAIQSDSIGAFIETFFFVFDDETENVFASFAAQRVKWDGGSKVEMFVAKCKSSVSDK